MEAHRPKEFESVDELQNAIDEYFDFCDSNTKTIVTKEGQPIEIDSPIPYTVEGLADHLDLTRQTILNYQKREGYEEFFNAIKKAKSKILRNKVERGLMGDSNPAITIFDLKNNYGYKDRTEVEQTNITINIDKEDADL